MALDAELISRSNRNNEEADNSEGNPSDYGNDEENDSGSRAGSLREAVQNEKNGNISPSGTDFNSLRMEAKRRQSLKEKSNKAVEAALSPIKNSTSGLLKAAWANLIISWGLTLIWIDIHVFLNQIFGKKMFVDLGGEWVPAKPGTTGADGAAMAEKAGESIGTVEKMGCGCLNFGCLFLLLGALSIISLLLGVITNPMEAIKALVDMFWGLFTRN